MRMCVRRWYGSVVVVVVVVVTSREDLPHLGQRSDPFFPLR